MLKLVTYAANTGVLPDDVSIPDSRWSFTESPGVDEPRPAATDPAATQTTFTPKGTLRISDPGPYRRIYARYDTLNPTDSAIFEINCQLISSDDGNGVAFGFIDTTNTSLEAFLFTKSIFVLAKGPTGTILKSEKFTTDDKFHIYRIVKTAAVKMEVYADGELVLDTPYGELGPANYHHPRQCIATSRGDKSEWDIAYWSYSIFPGV